MRRNTLLGFFALLLLTCFAYLPVLNGSSGFIWDDDAHVTANPSLHDAAGLANIWTWGPRALFDHSVTPATQQYYPATFSSFWIEYHLWQNNPLGYHITNVVLHLLSALLLWRLLRTLGLSQGISFFAAALFALHPVNVESVAWISERKNTLSLLFCLLATLAWLKWANLSKSTTPTTTNTTNITNTTNVTAPAKTLTYLLSLLLFFLSMMAKSVTAPLPAALLILAWWKRGRITKRDLLGLTPFFLLAAASAFLTTTIEHTPLPGYIGASGPDFAISPPARLLIAGHAVLFYIAKLLAPVHLVFFYPRWNSDTASLLQWLAPLAVLAILLTLFALRKKIGRAPLALALLFILALFPALGFFNFYPMQFSFVADHFQYLATIVGCTALAAALAQASALLARRIAIRPLTITLGAAILLSLSFLSFAQAHIYHDEITLYRKTLDRNPDAWIAADNLASLLASQPDPAARKQALDLAHATLARDINNPTALKSLGDTLFELQQFPDAQKAFERALIASPNNPSIERGIGDSLLLQNKPADAVPHYLAAANELPQDADYAAAAGIALLQARRPAEAEQQFRTAIDLATTGRGDLPRYYYLLGQSLHREEQLGAAIAALSTAIKLDPNRPEPFVETAEILAFLHKDAMAVDYYQSALHVKKDYTIAKTELAHLLLISDDSSVHNPLYAADLFRQVIEETHSTNPAMQSNYAKALAAAKFYEQAVDVLNETLASPALDPGVREALLAQRQQYQLATTPPVASTGTPVPFSLEDDESHMTAEPLPAPVQPKYIPPP
ncbi:MAG: tetratricopeptide repeat protein [Phycisphaerae bacterium]